MPEEIVYLCMTDGQLHGTDYSKQSEIVSYPSEGRIEEIDLGGDYRESISRWQDDGGK